MRLDALARLIESADFMSFRELALECLRLKGYKEVSLTDGWSDGGADVRVFQAPPNPLNIAIQITVEKDWKKKLDADAKKVSAKLKLVNMVLVCSRRIAEGEFQEEQERIFRELAVNVTRIDNQGIASTFFSAKRTGRVLEILGIDTSPGTASLPSYTPRQEAAFSFSFFGQDAVRFREASLESAIIAVIARRKQVPRHELEKEAGDILGIADAQKQRITSGIDRLIQRGDVRGPNSGLSLSDALSEAAETSSRLRIAQYLSLKREVGLCLKANKLRFDDGSLNAIMDNLGALLLDTSKSTFAALKGDEQQESAIAQSIKRRLRNLHSNLDALGASEGSARDELLRRLAELAANSPIGHQLLAGELYLTISESKTPQLIAALGARAGVQVLLDASVAIPMLCTLLFRPVNNRFSISASHVYKQLTIHGQQMVLPIDYLEEVATHLLRAFHDYGPIVDTEPDLSASENSFVSHYVSLRNEGDGTTFLGFLDAFGFDQALRKAEYYVARDRLKPKLQRLFDKYAVRVTPLGNSSAASVRKAQESLAYAIDKLNLKRPKVLVEHDARTLAYLHDKERTSEMAEVLCTWDRLHFWMREKESSEWQVLNPAVLGDIFALAAADDVEGSVAAPVVLALSLSEEAARGGSAVWDTLVHLEHGKMHDAELIRQAKAFKESYVLAASEHRANRDIEEEWARWKSEHYTKGEPK